MLSFIVKLMSADQTTENKEVKITLATGHGYKRREREKIDGVWGEWEEIESILDPDSYLPVLGIHASKSSIKSFEQLVDYMIENPNEIFNQALTVGLPSETVAGGFDEYVRRPNMLDKNEVAFSYIRSKQTPEMIAESYFRSIIRHLLNEGDASSKSTFPLNKVVWSDKLKIFSSGKWNLWNEKTSAKADGGHDPEGAEKAVAAMENLIFLGHMGYAFVGQEDGGVLIQGKGINAKLDADEAVEYIIGIRTSEDDNEPKLPPVKIRHVAGTEPYDLELVEPKTALEVKKMQSADKLAKLGSATGRLFDRHVKIIRPLRAAGQIAQKFIESGDVVDSKTGEALIRKIENPPEGMDVEGVANAVEMVNYLFNNIKYSYSKKELPGVIIKVEGGQIPAGMIARIKRSDFLNLDDRGNLFEACTKVLNDNLGDYSPAKDKSSLWTASEPWLQSKDDVVDITADAGGVEYEGKVSLEYFYDDLIFRLFDHTKEGVEIDESLILSYTQCMEMLAEIYSSLVKINERQGEDAFKEFITQLGTKKYGGFYGVSSNHYYSIPCDTDHLDVYGTTQGFRAVLLMTKIPSEGPKIPDVKIKKPVEEEEVDLEVDELELRDIADDLEGEIAPEEEESTGEEEEEENDTEESDRSDT